MSWIRIIDTFRNLDTVPVLLSTTYSGDLGLDDTTVFLEVTDFTVASQVLCPKNPFLLLSTGPNLRPPRAASIAIYGTFPATSVLILAMFWERTLLSLLSTRNFAALLLWCQCHLCRPLRVLAEILPLLPHLEKSHKALN